MTDREGARFVGGDELNALVEASVDPLLVLFYAEWSDESRKGRQILDGLARDRDDLTCCIVDVTENAPFVFGIGIYAVPSFRLYHHGKIIRRVLGATSKAELVGSLGLAGASLNRARSARREPREALHEGVYRGRPGIVREAHDETSPYIAPLASAAGAAARPAAPADTAALLSNRDFLDLSRLFDERAVLPEEFERLPMPEGYSRAQVWDALWLARRPAGIYGPDLYFLHGRVVPQWHYLTSDLLTLVRRAESATQAGSPLSRAFAEREAQHFVTSSLVREIAISLRNDRLSVTDEAVEEVVRGKRDPRTTAEQVARNMHRLLGSLGDYAEAPFTPELVAKLHERLMEGVSPDAMPWAGRAERYRPEWITPPPEASLQIICAAANERITGRKLSPVVNAFNCLCRFWRTGPFPFGNYCTGSVFVRLYLMRRGFPVFRYLAFSSLIDDWSRDAVPQGLVHTAYRDAGVLYGGEREWTDYFESLMRLLVREIDQVEAEALRITQRDGAMIDSVMANESMNHRQRDILSRALLVPETAFSFAELQRTYRVSYATAHRDLTSLAARGFLEEQREGRKIVFRATPALPKLLAR